MTKHSANWLFLLSPSPSQTPNTTTLTLTIQNFISIYSAHIYFRPTTIYIHTNTPLSTFTSAKTTGNDWTKRTLSLPSLKHNYIVPPTHTKKGIPIITRRDQSEFLRIQILHEYGGIYLSPTSVPLRSISALLNSGFANILSSGTQDSKFVYNDVMISAPRSALMEIYLKASHEFFSASSSPSNSFFKPLLSTLTTRLSIIPNEILILPPSAFAPLPSTTTAKHELFAPHTETVAGLDVRSYNEGEGLTRCGDMLKLLIDREIYGGEEWEGGFEGAWVLGGFEGGEDWGDGEVREGKGGSGEVDLEYVLARQSVWSRAVYPAVQEAIREGYILGV